MTRPTDSTAPIDSEGAASSKKRSGGKFAGATLVVLSVVATWAPFLAGATLGFTLEWTGRYSTGGFLALTASIVMWAKCRSWNDWVRWIWLPIGIVVVLSFALVNAQVTDARAELERTCATWGDQLADVAQQREDLAAESAEFAQMPAWRSWEPAPPRPLPPGMTDWSAVGDGVSDEAAAWAYFVEYGGPELDERFEQLGVKLSEFC